MISKPMDVPELFPVRKSSKQKKTFRDAVLSYTRTLGYDGNVERGSMGSRNVVIGDPEKAKYLITAHYDTCARMPFPNLITPCSFLLFLAYQIFMVIVIFGAAIICGVAVGLLMNDAELAGIAAYLFVWLFLILMMVGPANKHNANDNTSGVVTLLEIAWSMPGKCRDQVCFILFDLEEAGLIGSASYRKKHKKASENQIVLNLDCVGDGDEILFFATKKLKKDEHKMALLRRCGWRGGEKSIAIREKGFAVYPSDQSNFPYGVGICALRRSRWAGLYLGRIHTRKDTILDVNNINILRAALVSMICGGAVN